MEAVGRDPMSHHDEDALGNPRCCLGESGGICQHHANTLRWGVTGQPIFPNLKQPGWRNEVKTGDANRSDEAPSLVLARQKAQREIAVARTRRRQAPITRLLRATTGAFTGRNRRGGFVHRIA
jgi:hypothetical protein